LELPQKPDTDQAFAHWLEELEMLRRELEIRFNVTISNADLEEAIKMMNRERALKRKLADLMMEEEPPLSGRELLDLKALVSCIPADMEQYEKALEVLPGRRLNPPAGERIRVLLTGVPFPHMAERVLDIIESNGGLVVCQENCTGIKPVLEDVTEGSGDPLRAIAEKYFHLPCSVMTANEARLESLRALVDRYRPQAIIEIIWQACITYDVESYLVHDFVEKELKLPYLKIETDYSPSDSARIALRVEALFETIQNR